MGGGKLGEFSNYIRIKSQFHTWSSGVSLTDALPPDVLLVAHVALAAVAAVCGDAAAVQTQVGEVSAHVDGLVHSTRA